MRGGREWTGKKTFLNEEEMSLSLDRIFCIETFWVTKGSIYFGGTVHVCFRFILDTLQDTLLYE